jgi:hypothetical protein
MINLPRRKFLKNLSLCTLLLATGNVRQGLSYISPVRDHNNNFITPKTGDSPICFMGIGEIGLKIGGFLSKGLNSLPNKGHYNYQTPLYDNTIKILQFNLYQKGLTALLEKKDLVFLTGSLEDENFWIARDLILNTGTKLLINIIPSYPDTDIIKAANIVRPDESFINIDENDFTQTAINVVRDVSSLLLLPTLICIDFADIKEALEVSSGKALYNESPIEQSIERYRTFVLRNKHLLMKADAFCLALSCDYRNDLTLDHLTRMSDELYRNSKKDAAIIWSCTDVQRLNNDFRATLLSVQKHG